MLTMQQAEAMRPEDRTQLFERLAAETGETWAAVAASLGVGKRTAEKWRAEDNVPPWALVLMTTWAAGPAHNIAQLSEVREIAERLDRIASEVRAVAELLAKAVRRLPAASAETAARP